MAKSGKHQYNIKKCIDSYIRSKWTPETHLFFALLWNPDPENPWQEYWDNIPAEERAGSVLLINGNTHWHLISSGFVDGEDVVVDGDEHVADSEEHVADSDEHVADSEDVDA